MTTPLPLDSRQARITRRLLETVGPASVDALATELNLTDRMVRYNLASVDSVLAEHGLRLARQSGIGIWIEGSPAAREELLEALDRSAGPAVLDPTDRRGRILLALLVAAPDALRSEALEDRLGVSRPTIRRDMRGAEDWLEQHRLHLRRMPGKGIAVVGSEIDVRGGLLALLLEIVPVRVLLNRTATDGTAVGGTIPANRKGPVQTDVDAFLTSLDLDVFRGILAGELRDIDDQDPTVTMAALSIAIAATRIREIGRAHV